MTSKSKMLIGLGLCFCFTAKPMLAKPAITDPNRFVYFTAALFADRENIQNFFIAKGLEDNGYDVFLPQRDGFNFVSLTNTVERLKDSSGKVLFPLPNIIVQSIIYFLDEGWALPNSKIIVSNFNEPVDEGVIVENVQANMHCDKVIVAYRDSIKSPYGRFPEEPFGGMHFFPAYNVYSFILSISDASVDLDTLLYSPGFSVTGTTVNPLTRVLGPGMLSSGGTLGLILSEINFQKANPRATPDEITVCKQNKVLVDLHQGAVLLFGNILGGKDIFDPLNRRAFIAAIHDPAVLAQIGLNFKANQTQLLKLRPRTINNLFEFVTGTVLNP